MNIQEMGCGVDCIDLARDRDRWTALLDAVIKFSIKCGEFLDYLRNC
jgi:hypothetical protein